MKTITCLELRDGAHMIPSFLCLNTHEAGLAIMCVFTHRYLAITGHFLIWKLSYWQCQSESSLMVPVNDVLPSSECFWHFSSKFNLTAFFMFASGVNNLWTSMYKIVCLTATWYNKKMFYPEVGEQAWGIFTGCVRSDEKIPGHSLEISDLTHSFATD